MGASLVKELPKLLIWCGESGTHEYLSAHVEPVLFVRHNMTLPDATCSNILHM